MEIRITFERTDEVIAAFRRAPGIMADHLRLATKISLRDLAESARSNHRFTSRSGDLERAIETKIDADGLGGQVGFDPAAPGSKYAEFVHEGTSPHEIFPVNRKALRWVGGTATVFGNIGSEFAFAKKVNHPGTDSDQFLYEAARRMEGEIQETYRRFIATAIKEVQA